MPVNGVAVLVEDSVGNIVPEELKDVFISGRELERKSKQISELQKWIQEASTATYGRYIHAKTAVADLENVKQALKFSRPYSICTFCSGQAATCGACHGSGYLNKRIYDASPVGVRG